MGNADAGDASPGDLRKLTYEKLREGLLSSYREKQNKTIYTTADGKELIWGLKQLDKFVGYEAGKNPGPSLVRLNTDLSRRFAKKMQEDDYSSATINRSLACLRRMLAIAREDGKLKFVPVIRLLKEPKARKGFVTAQQFDAIVAELPRHLRPLFEFLYWTGCRLGEALAVRWNQVNLTERMITLDAEQTKTDEPRNIPLPGVVVKALAEIEDRSGPVFDRLNYRHGWERACARAELGKIEVLKSPKGFTWYKYSGVLIHDLRRSAIRNLRLAKVPEGVAMKISGHKTRTIFDRYNITNKDDVSSAMRAVETLSLQTEIGVKLVSNRRKPALLLG
jgi:integrase